jgi:hypothetical protein
MSVQLILYPQSYNGQYNAISNVATEKLVDGINFYTINTSSSVDVASANASTAITSAPPNIINTWYRSRSTSSGTPALPDSSGGSLYLYSVVGAINSSVYQKLSNLTVGATYNIIVKLNNTASGLIYVAAYNGTTLATIIGGQATITTLVGGQIVSQFTAQTTTDIVQINYINTVIDTFEITGISVIPTGQMVTYTNFSLEDGQVICDLYQEEDIPLTLSVDDFKNVAEKVQSYSKDFNLPATKRNNLIFDSIFEITRSDDGIIFNPYIKTQCVLKQEGYILFEGYLRLIDIQDQEGEISYNVNLYSEVVALADVLKDRTFSDLDFTELEHDYQKTNIKRSWNEDPDPSITYLNPSTSGFRQTYDTVKYPFVDWSHQILISDGTNGIIDYPELSVLQQAFRPFINIKYLINRIFEDTPFTWSSDFFNATVATHGFDFDKLYMDFNWGSNQINPYEIGEAVFSQQGTPQNFAAVTPNWTTLVFEHDVTFGILSGYDLSTSVFTCTNDNTEYNITYNIRCHNHPTTGVASADMKIEWYSTGAAGSMQTTTFTGILPDEDVTYAGTINPTLMSGDTLYCRFQCLVGNATTIQQGSTITYSDDSIAGTIATSVMSSGAISNELRGEVGQWDFLKGIMTMFNIISMPDKNNPLNITFEPYGDVFVSDTAGINLASRSIEHDWTEKVDVSEMKLMPLTDLNKNTVFKFVEDEDDYSFSLYKKSTDGHLYGSKLYDASAYTILAGEDEIIAEPFAATVPKPLFDQFGDFIVPAIFTSNNEATEFEGFDNAPRIMYNNGIKTLNGGVTYYIPAQNGLSSENQPNFLQFSHLTDISTISGTIDFHFGECQYFNPIGSTVPDNLFNLYWLPYYNELYNPNTRIMTMKVNLTPADINTFKFEDKVMIKNRVFRVNKIDYKPNNLATVEFILIP